MKHILLLFLFLDLSAQALGQQIDLVGVLKTDSNKPVPSIKVSVAGGQARPTDPKGQFKIILSNDFKEGQRVLIKVFRYNWVINHPVDGEWNLPNIREENIKTLDVVIVPKGSKALWAHERIEKYVGKLSDEIAKLKKEGNHPKPVDFTSYLSEWAKEYGFTPDQVKQQFDAWADDVATSDDDRKKGLSAFYQGKYDLADEYFDKVTLRDEERVKQDEKKLEKDKLIAYQDWKIRGNNASADYKFAAALKMYERAETHISKDKYPTEWAEIKFLLGQVKEALGTRVEGQESRSLLSGSIKEYQQALTVFTLEKLPLHWAATQNNLGVSLTSQGGRLAGAEGDKLLHQSVEAFHEAFKVYSFEKLPKEWAATKHNLGAALTSQGERLAGPEGMELLQQSVEAFREALTVRSPKQLPRDWAATQVNLGDVLSFQGQRLQRVEGAKLLAQAVEAYREALKICTIEETPEQWAAIQISLGIAFSAQGEWLAGVEGINLLRQGNAAFREALKVFTSEQLPQDWAMTQNDLGHNLQLQGQRLAGEEGKRLLQQSVNILVEALKVTPREQLPQLWVTTQNNLGRTYYVLQDWIAAAEAYENVLTIYSNYPEAYSRLTAIYHEALFKFEDAFAVNQQWVVQYPGDVSAQVNFAEKQFTTGRFLESAQLISTLVAKPDVSPGMKTALRATQIADLLALGQPQLVFVRMDTIIADVSHQPAEFKVDWPFEGTKHFINHSEKLSPYRLWLEELFVALANPARDQILKALKEVKADFK